MTKYTLDKLALAPIKRRALKRTRNEWSQSQKIEAVLTYIATGSETKTAAATGIPKGTINMWRYQPWWKELIAQIHEEKDDQITTDITRILDKSIENVMDRLENGDFGFNQKTGEVFRKPVNLRDSHKVLVDMIDKRNLLTGKPTQRVEAIDTKNQLEFLAKKFAEFATMGKQDLKRAINQDTVVDVEVDTDAGN